MIAFVAIGYVAALLAVTALLRFVGEAWWVTTAGLYLPRIGFALPLPALVLALLALGPRHLLWGVPIPAALLLFPLMGLELGTRPLLGTAHAAAPRLRVLSYNVQSAMRADEMAALIDRAAPDLVLLQEWNEQAADLLFATLPGFRRHVAGQFAVYSRYPITDVYVPPRVAVTTQRDRAARFVRYTVATPLGPIAVINMHPVSPRSGLEEVRRNGIIDQLGERSVAAQEGIEILRSNAELRWRQAEAVVSEAARAASATAGRVLIAGDTNLPGLSRIFAQTLATFHDGFDVVGRGFGYTFPSERPWMRIDRILAGGALAFTRFEVVPEADPASDHLAVLAEITAEPAAAP